MRLLQTLTLTLTAVCLTGNVCAQTGPFSPEDWPATIDKTKIVHYVVTDPGLDPPSDTWLADNLQILSGGDQGTTDFCIRGHNCKKVTGTYLNVLDADHTVWADKDNIDILVQVYGDAALLNAQGQPRNFVFLTGALPNLNFPVGGQIPVEAKNKQWNWVLFRIVNGIAPDGSHYVGGAPAPGGVNGGTIRFEVVQNLIIRVIAFGEEGAFGTPEDINVFSTAPPACDPEPNTNLASIDINAGTANHLQVLNDGDQTVTIVESVGPAGDKRKAVAPNGLYLNFGITDNYLGKPCNDPHSVKVCVDFYDDPAFAGLGVSFGPEAYALDEGGCVGFYPADQRVTLTGSDRWIHRSWSVPAVNLKGVNAGTLTAGPRFISQNGQVAVSRFALAVLREGDHPLAGQDPLADCLQDENVCKGIYGDYAELDLGKDPTVTDGLDLGGNGGDQQYVVEEAGPANDRRMAVRPLQDESTPRSWYLNFAITGEKLGPTSQDPAHLAICVTYYDDPALIGAQFRSEVYSTERGGVSQYAFCPASYNVALEGTDTWRTAYWEITDMKFAGVNQGPQAAARFWLGDKIHFTRVRYAVIRPCGPTAGVNLLEECKPAVPSLAIRTSGKDAVEVYWSVKLEGWTLEENPNVANPDGWSAVTTAPVVQGDQHVVKLSVGSKALFFRLTK